MTDQLTALPEFLRRYRASAAATLQRCDEAAESFAGLTHEPHNAVAADSSQLGESAPLRHRPPHGLLQ